jgi:hypothetical protein
VLTGSSGPHDVLTGSSGPHDVLTGSSGPHDVLTGSSGPHDVLTEIADRLHAGRMTEAEAWRARGLALLEPDRLPPDLAAFPTASMRCMTPTLLELRRHQHLLAPSSRALLAERAVASSPFPQYDKLSLDSSKYPIRIHYQSTALATTAAQVLALAEHSWEVEVLEVGFAAPVPDGSSGGDSSLDYYLVPSELVGGGAYTQPSGIDVDPADGLQSCSAYIALNQDLNSEPGDPDEVMSVYVAHEFNHVLQSAMDFEEFAWAWEVTATFMEDVVYDDVNDYYGYIPSFQRFPEQNLIYFPDDSSGSNPYLLYPYGATIFLHFLNEGLSSGDGRIAVDLWKRSEQGGTTNEPDFLDAVEEVANAHGWGGMLDIFARFSTWRYFVGKNDDGHHFQEGGDWFDADPPVLASFDLSDLPRQGATAATSDLGVDYLVVNTGNGQGKQLRITASSTGSTRLGLIASRIRSGSGSEDVVLVTEPEKGEVSGVIELEDSERVMIGLLNDGHSSYDAESAPSSTSISYSIELEEAGTTEGCGCTTGGRPKPWTTAWLLGASALLHQRRLRRDAAGR